MLFAHQKSGVSGVLSHVGSFFSWQIKTNWKLQYHSIASRSLGNRSSYLSPTKNILINEKNYKDIAIIFY